MTSLWPWFCFSFIFAHEMRGHMAFLFGLDGNWICTILLKVADLLSLPSHFPCHGHQQPGGRQGAQCVQKWLFLHSHLQEKISFLEDFVWA